MKKFWKALGIAALAAAVPVRFKKDEETGKKTFQSLLWKLDIEPAEDGEGMEIGLDLMEGVLTAPLMKTVASKKETIHFADDEPEAAMVEAIDFDQAAEDAQTANDEAQAVEDVQDAANEAGEEDFDPEM